MLVVGGERGVDVVAFLASEQREQAADLLRSDYVNPFVGGDLSAEELAATWAGLVADDPQRAILLDLGGFEARAAIIAAVSQDDVAHGAAGAWVGVHGRSDVTGDVGHGLVEVVVGRGVHSCLLAY